MSKPAEQVATAIQHLQRGLETGHADEYRKAQSIVRKLEQDARTSPEEKARRVHLENARKAEQALAGPAAAYQRYLKKTGRVA